MPYPNEHAARQADPERFVKFRRETDALGDGIDVIWGITADGKAEIQGIRFDAQKYSPEQARKWLREHGFKTDIEPAEKASSAAAAAAQADLWTDPALPRLSGTAYNGGPIEIDGWRGPVVFDLASFPETAVVPLCVDHRFQLSSTLGLARVRNTGRELVFDAVLLRNTDLAADVQAWAARVPLPVSVGVLVRQEQRLNRGERAVVNGRDLTGPLTILRGRLQELSAVPAGADETAGARLAAASGYISGGSMNDNERTELQTLVDETKRREAIEEAARARMKGARASTCQKIADAAAAALTKGQTVEEFARELDALLLHEATAWRAEPQLTKRVAVAALARAGGLKVELAEAEEEAAAQAPKTLAELVCTVARAAGYSGRNDMLEALDYTQRMARAGGPSTLDLGDVIAGVGSRFLIAAYRDVDTSWREIALVRSLPDFRPVKGVVPRLTATFPELPAGGEIPQTTASDTAYTLEARDYGRSIKIDRRILVNDDIGAIADIARQLGLGAGRTVASRAWNVFRAAHVASASSAALNVATLAAAETTLATKTDSAGQIIGWKPEILVCSTSLAMRATQLYMAEYTMPEAAISAERPTANVFRGRFRVVSTPYLTAGDWALCATPSAGYLLVGFLKGQDTPTIERVNLLPDYSGIALVAVFGFDAAAGPSDGLVAYKA